ncbi:MAG: hypothetical protein GY789_22315 [Hyphomicrobiales bacterium]|nr:hypothetical protein [Hyphomicrobiales bacterium]MCP4999206.1 hypothetical protein [Hyphomicrobiales bacterium]
MRRIRRIFAWLLVGLVLLAIVLAIPVVYVETACREVPNQDDYEPIVANAAFERSEANTYLTYPEWHIVYAYEGLANVLKNGDEHDFDYTKSVVGFWKSFCDLNRMASQHGAADFSTRATIHTIGVSFTLEMMLKAAYEETLGRLFANNRGAQKAPQDKNAANVAADYAQFLHQVPWYKYDFDSAVETLWNEPLTQPVRGWERRIALGGEWKVKSVYASVIAEAVAATGQAQLKIRSVITGMPAKNLAAIPGIVIVESRPHYTVIETPRYRRFTEILKTVAASGGRVMEIAGNDDIMVSLIGPARVLGDSFSQHQVISVLGRDGFDTNRILVSVKIPELAPLLVALNGSALDLEHIYDY